MCIKVEGLIKTLEETEIDNTHIDVDSVCKELNRMKLNDHDIFRITRVLFKNKKWGLLGFLVSGILAFYLMLSIIVAIVVTATHVLLVMIVPSAFAMAITLTILLITVSAVQHRSGL